MGLRRFVRDNILQSGRAAATWRGRVWRWTSPGSFGKDVRIGRGVTILRAEHVWLDDAVIVSDGVQLAATPIGKADEAVLRIGRGVFMNSGCALSARCLVDIGADVTIGPNVVIVDHDHRHDDPSRPIARQGLTDGAPIHIGAGSWIGAGAVILAGTAIGPRSVVAANAVVRGDYGPRSLIAGIPARAVRDLAS
jgi:acetyltransferase-like isoleucine patch superfamily enzyme